MPRASPAWLLSADGLAEKSVPRSPPVLQGAPTFQLYTFVHDDAWLDEQHRKAPHYMGTSPPKSSENERRPSAMGEGFFSCLRQLSARASRPDFLEPFLPLG